MLQRRSDCLKLQREVDELDDVLKSGSGGYGWDSLDSSLKDSYARLESAKKVDLYTSEVKYYCEVICFAQRGIYTSSFYFARGLQCINFRHL